MRLERLGTDYGGWTIPPDLIRADWVCYSAGVGEDVSFDLALIDRFGVEVWAFDPTPKSIAYVKSSIDEPRFHFEPVGVWSDDGTQRFYLPADSDHVSASITDPQQTQEWFEATVKSLGTIAREHGHETIDLLKLDIEGAEYEVLRRLERRLRPRVLCVEFHGNPIRALEPVVRAWVSRYRLAHREGRDFVFVHRSVLQTTR